MRVVGKTKGAGTLRLRKCILGLALGGGWLPKPMVSADAR
jgi:hypothetical protein